MLKWQRMMRLCELLRKGGYTARGLAAMTGVHVRTIQRDLREMQDSPQIKGLVCEGTLYRMAR